MQVLQQYSRWCCELPRVTPHYAVKCNGDVMLLKALAALHPSGSGRFDCATKAEMEAVLALGTSPEHIVYSNPCKLVWLI